MTRDELIQRLQDLTVPGDAGADPDIILWREDDFGELQYEVGAIELSATGDCIFVCEGKRT